MNNALEGGGMDATAAIEMLRFVRGLTMKAFDGLDQRQLTTVPAGFNNNILWNAGHILYYTCAMTYGPAGQPIPLPAEYKDLFKANTSPADWKEAPDGAAVLRELGSIVDRIAADNADGKFGAFKGMTLGPRSLGTIQEALVFHCFHEGLHLGRITSLKKLV